jgi:hypothetical protein
MPPLHAGILHSSLLIHKRPTVHKGNKTQKVLAETADVKPRVKAVARRKNELVKLEPANDCEVSNVNASTVSKDSAPRMSAEAIKAVFRDQSARARRSHVLQAFSVDNTQESWLYKHYDVMRIDGFKLRITPQMLALFYDLQVCQATTILNISKRTMRNVRNWCNLSRWPRDILMSNTHPVLTVDAVRSERISVMLSARASNETLLYDMLRAAHELSGCSVEEDMAKLEKRMAKNEDKGDAARLEKTGDAARLEKTGDAARLEKTGDAARLDFEAPPAGNPASSQAVIQENADWDDLLTGSTVMPFTDVDNKEWEEFLARTSDGDF